jgi:hypothetical protein
MNERLANLIRRSAGTVTEQTATALVEEVVALSERLDALESANKIASDLQQRLEILEIAAGKELLTAAKEHKKLKDGN